ncbi:MULTISPECIES: HNH endonuclease [Bacillus]|uniref:HNH endonuclease n=1 Tax=Bacillus TaxID=1386 RepID=UPI000B5D996B|nr:MULTISPECIES: HNH endonuclease [Bacillus]OXB95534.1 hypothetical protein CGQ22_29045 [Bacillus sp. M13(2017)]QCY60456.1 HNH endonuclease [Bacillus thuringiensis]
MSRRKRIQLMKITINGVSVEAKECTKCNEIKPLEEFSRHKDGLGGRVSHCKCCKKIQYQKDKSTIGERHKLYYLKNREIIKQRVKEYRIENKEYVKQQHKLYYEKNKTKLKEYKKQHYIQNKEHYRELSKQQYEQNKLQIKAYKKKHYQENKQRYQELGRIWCIQNKELAREYKNKWKKRNPETVRLHKLRRRAREYTLLDTLTIKEQKEILDHFMGCALTEKREDIHFDHFIPLSVGHGGTILENMVPLCAEVNMSKGNKNPFEWIKTRDDIALEKWDKLVRYLAMLNNMTMEEFETYVYWCFENPNEIEIEESEEDTV